MQQNTGEKKSKNKEKRTRVIKIRITGGVILAIVIVCVILKILNADPSSVFLKNTKAFPVEPDILAEFGRWEKS